MSQRAYAKHRGCTPKAVRKALAAGRISLSGDQIDSDKADADWQANTDPLKGATGGHGHLHNSPEAASLAQFKVERARLQLQREQMELDRDAGLLVPLAELEDMFAELISLTRTKVLALPGKIKGRLLHLSTEDVLAVDELAREALEELANVASAGR